MVDVSALTAERSSFDDIAAIQEHFHASGWSDGLPIVPPTPDAVAACLDWALLDPDELIGVEPVRQRAVTAEKVAINNAATSWWPTVTRGSDSDRRRVRTPKST